MLLNKKGMSLFEVVVVIALFMVVMAAGYSLLMAGNNHFTRSKLRSDIQYEIRMVSDYIRDELRNATEVELLSSFPGTYEAGYNYIEIDDTNKKIILNGVDKDLFFDLTVDYIGLEAEVGEHVVIFYKLTGVDDSRYGTKLYTVDTRVLLNNIRYFDSDEVLPTSGIAIKYRFESLSP